MLKVNREYIKIFKIFNTSGLDQVGLGYFLPENFSGVMGNTYSFTKYLFMIALLIKAYIKMEYITIFKMSRTVKNCRASSK